MDALNVVTLADAKVYLTIDYPDLDSQISAGIYAMVALVEQITNYRLYQRNEVVICGVEKYDAFQYPLNRVVSVTGSDGYPSSGFRFKQLPLRNTFEFETCDSGYFYADRYPDLFINGQVNSNTITLDVGYSDPAQIPQALISAVKILITDFIENRIPTKEALPNNVQLLLAPFMRSTLF